MLRSLKMHPQPASQVSSPYYAVLDPALCSGCGVCVRRCQMDALVLADGKAALDPGRCIGCGLCVTTCKRGALTLARKPKAQQPDVPKNIAHLYIRMARSRGRLRTAELARLVTRSALDRFLTRFFPVTDQDEYTC